MPIRYPFLNFSFRRRGIILARTRTRKDCLIFGSGGSPGGISISRSPSPLIVRKFDPYVVGVRKAVGEAALPLSESGELSSSPPRSRREVDWVEVESRGGAVFLVRNPGAGTCSPGS